MASGGGSSINQSTTPAGMMINPSWAESTGFPTKMFGDNAPAAAMSWYGAQMPFVVDPSYISSQVQSAMQRYQPAAPVVQRDPSSFAYYHASPNAAGIASLNSDFTQAPQVGGLPSLMPNNLSMPSQAQLGYAQNFGLGGIR